MRMNLMGFTKSGAGRAVGFAVLSACLFVGQASDADAGETASAVNDRRVLAVQLDLARQKETVPFVKEYMRRMAKAGYNTFVMYLEDRVKTASYPYPSDADSYSPSEIRDIVAEGTRLGLDIVPVVSPLGHTERFLAHDALAKFGEKNGGSGRFGPGRGSCFCLENPEAREWMENYIREVAELFPGPNFHFGFDETFDLGFCTTCRPILENEGLAALYMRHVEWAHGVAKKIGKRMWIWDDYFEYFDPSVLEKVPRDVMLCFWNYLPNIEPTGPRGHFGGRQRRDVLRTYERLGIDCVVCPWFSYENVRTITEYASARRSSGFFFTQWEMETDFHAIFYPRVLAAANLWNGRADHVSGEWITKALRETYPSLDDEALRLVEGLMFDQLKLKFSSVTVDSILNGPHETSALRYWRAALAAIRRHASAPGRGAVPPDQLSEEGFLEDLAVRTEMAILCEETRRAARYFYVPERTAEQSASARRELGRIRARWQELVSRRAEQWATWRPGINSAKEAAFRAHLTKQIDAALARPDVAPDSEWVLEADLAMIDTHGAPVSTVEVRTSGGEWKKIASGVWKPRVDDFGYVAKTIPVELDFEPDELRLSVRGYGAATFCHVSLRNVKRRLAPFAVLGAAGEFTEPENLLVDDFRECRIGHPDCTEAINKPKYAELVSYVDLGVR